MTGAWSESQTRLSPAEFVARHGEIFSVFDWGTQDSGNLSYGVRAGDERFFVKTAGVPNDDRPLLSHLERVALLRNAVRLARSVTHHAMPALRHVVESPDGPLLIYDWADGALLRTPREERSNPASPFARFLALPTAERVAALDTVFHLHRALAARAWIASDFYDGCLLYDFAARRMHVVDLDNYRDAPFANTMGRMFGSTRFMAPEELTLGARIDERTTVFALGRTAQQFLPAECEAVERIAQFVAHACEDEPSRRFATVEDFHDAWRSVTEMVRG